MKTLSIAFALALGFAGAAHAAADREVTIPAGKGLEAGSLRVPDGFSHGPAVLMIAGSGPTDRNGDSNMGGVKPASTRLMADALEAAGVPSLRYDKRGVGASALALGSESELRFTDGADDAAAWVRLLAAQPGVSCVVIYGHSEGSLLAMLAAQQVPVCGLISVAGAGRPIAEILREQVLLTLPDDEAGKALRAKVIATLDALKAGHTVADAPLPALFRPSIQPYLISWLPLDPAVEIGKVKAPMLILQGDNDLQVAVSDAKRLAAARPDAQLVIVPGMTHVLKIAAADRAANLATYTDPVRPLAPEAVKAVVQFVKATDPRH